MMSPFTPVQGSDDENLIHQLVVGGNVNELAMNLSRMAPALPMDQIVNSKDDKGMVSFAMN